MDFLSWLRDSQQQITVVAFIFVIGTLAFIIRSLVADNAERVDELSKRQFHAWIMRRLRSQPSHCFTKTLGLTWMGS